MKPTGYALLALAALLCVYVGVSHLILDAKPVEDAGTVNAASYGGSNGYWLALIPAAGAAMVGLYMVLTRQRGYQHNYDMSRQQAPGNA